MKTRFIAISLFLVSAVCSASAAPVLYSFNLTGTGSNTQGSPSYLSFQYLSPSYITASSTFLNAIYLSNISIDPNYSLFSVELVQTNLPTYTIVDVQTTVLEKFDFNQGVTIDFNFSNGPGGQNIVLDRDGTYTEGAATLSVAAAPEPSSFSLLLLAAPAAWVYRRRQRR